MENKKIYYWPNVRSTLPANARRKISPPLIKKLSRANLFLWKALNLYDDLIDDDGGRIALPLANNYYRRFLEIYYRLNLKADFYRLFNKLLKTIEAANRAEILQPKLMINDGQIILPKTWPDFSDLTILSDKSIILSCGPLAILSYLGYEARDRQINATLNFFRYALSAKQLADDASDWLELKKRRAYRRQYFSLKSGSAKKITLNIKRQPETIYLLFAAKAAGKLSEQITELCKKARIEAIKIGLKNNCRLLKEIVYPLENAAAETAVVRERADQRRPRTGAASALPAD